MFNLKNYFLILLVIISVTFLRHSLTADVNALTSQKKFIPPSKNINHLTFGFNEIIADSLWIRWIQNIDACGKALSQRSDVIKKEELSDNDFSAKLTEVQKNKVCDQGWSFRMLNAVTDLSPKFKAPYMLGAANLSVIAEDHVGAKIIFEKGIKNYPNDWSLLFRGAYHFLYELNDLKTAGLWLKKAAENGAPSWLYSLSSRVYSEAGQIDFGIKVLEEYLKSQTEPKHIESINQRLELLRTKL